MLRQHQSHPRDWRENLYVYPVISRRSRGLSIGINLNPDAACNFDCLYCQVDRRGWSKVGRSKVIRSRPSTADSRPAGREVDVARVGEELSDMIARAKDGSLFEDPALGDVPKPLRRINDFAFSGDGEPTTCKWFRECVELTAGLKRSAKLDDVKLVLITDACYLGRPGVVDALKVLDHNNGEIWAKLDAGTEEYYQRVNRPNFPLQHVIDNITDAARARPVVIQSLFMRLHGVGPDEGELLAYVERLTEITNAGGRIDRVQVYTVARRPAEDYVSALTNAEVDHIADLVGRSTRLRAEAFYGTT